MEEVRLESCLWEFLFSWISNLLNLCWELSGNGKADMAAVSTLYHSLRIDPRISSQDLPIRYL